ncbi:MAG: chromophore lyase CpcT/CpeT [Phycisphaerae bacterium]|nr:chromophore lyase CpcT/CpeT [Phycisphaerae bacterium]
MTSDHRRPRLPTRITAPQLPVILLLVFLLGGGCEALGPVGGTAAAPLAALAEVMEGAYASTEQSRVDPEYRDIALHVEAIWPARVDGPWLYLEQAPTGALNQPYRQRVCRLVLADDPEQAAGTIELRVFELPGDPIAFAGAWREPARFDSITPAELRSREGCTVYLLPPSEGRWIGATEGQDCHSAFRGARYATSEFLITADAMQIWDRGFDKDGNQVSGPVKGAYHFGREPEQPATLPVSDPARAKPMGT